MKYAIVHLADIHYRKGEPEGASTILNALIKDLQKQKESLVGHELYMAITGDIVFAGKDYESYSSFYIEFNQKLNDIGLTKEFRMIVPGNHDIDRSIVEKDFNDYQSKIYNSIETEQKFNNFISDENFRGLQGRTLVYKLTGYLNSDSGLHATPIKNRYPPASPAIVYHCIHPKRRHAWQVAGRCRVRLIILLPEVV